jgi:processive 1,2-diacylglycerol beta-glucosyltransferase
MIAMLRAAGLWPATAPAPAATISRTTHRAKEIRVKSFATPRVLIVTAAFGEGHNSAARNLGLALKAAGAEVEICDPCLRSARHATRLIAAGYLLITTHFPWIWQRVYRLTDRTDFSRQSLPLMKKPERFLASLIADYQPHAIVSTYPVYPYFIARAFRKNGGNVPVFTVVTDSIEINASWLRAPSDHWLVTDPATRTAMALAGVADEKIQATGFPVHPDFSRLPPVRPTDACEPFRILFFPTAKSTLASNSRALLHASADVKLTVALGKSARKFHAEALKIQQEHPGRVRLIGWTKRIPSLLNRHHLVVGKAGGATVHEAIAARCPMLIHHLVPGQEEGNLQLLESIGCGQLCDQPPKLTAAVRAMLEQNATGWRAMKHRVARHDRNSGALVAAEFILSTILR